jgi:hypothetical protein
VSVCATTGQKAAYHAVCRQLAASRLTKIRNPDIYSPAEWFYTSSGREQGIRGPGDGVELIASLREVIRQQSSVIESVKPDLADIKLEQQYLKSQNTEL